MAMDPLSLGVGAAVGIALDRSLDALGRKIFWSDEQMALREIYLGQQEALLLKRAHERTLERLASREAVLEKKLRAASGMSAARLEARLAGVKAKIKRLKKEGPQIFVHEGGKEPAKAAKAKASA